MLLIPAQAREPAERAPGTSWVLMRNVRPHFLSMPGNNSQSFDMRGIEGFHWQHVQRAHVVLSHERDSLRFQNPRAVEFAAAHERAQETSNSRAMWKTDRRRRDRIQASQAGRSASPRLRLG